MRKINRRAVRVPDSLRASALRGEKRELEYHYRQPTRVRASRRAPFNESVLLKKDVVDALGQVFRLRCAICEDKVDSIEQNISHFRPARGIEIPRPAGDGPSRFSSDHYGWLAYEWRNLLLVCSACRKVQGAKFLVRGTLAPVLCTWSEANDIEDVQLLDPCVDDPLTHFALQASGDLVALTSRGLSTLELYDLNFRSYLREMRARSVKALVQMLRGGSDWQHQSADGVLDDLERRRDANPGAVLLAARSILYQVEAQAAPHERQVKARSADELFRALSAAGVTRLDKAIDSYEEGRPTPRVRAYLSSAAAKAARLERTGDGRVRRINIKSFKGIGDLSIDFMRSGERTFSSPCAVLLGENAVGKSSVLQALCLTLSVPEERRRLRPSVEDFLSRDGRYWEIGQELPQVAVELDDGDVVKLAVDSKRTSFTGEGTSAVLLLAYGARRYFESNKQSKAIENKTLFDPLATIADSTPWLQYCSTEDFDAVARAMADVLSLQAGDHIFRGEDGKVMVQAHGRNTPISQMSDGYKSLFAMAVDIMCRMVQRWGNLEAARGVVLIDEIETHLHPRWKLQVMGALRLALPQVQFIVTTHDPLCLRGMGDHEVIVLNRDAAGVVGQQEGLPSVVGLRAEQLLTSDYFGLVSTTDPEMDRLLDQYVQSAQNAGQQASPGAELTNRIGQQIASVTSRGDTVTQQLAAEAVARYLAMKRAQPLVDSSAVREDAVKAILAMLNKKDGDAVR